MDVAAVASFGAAGGGGFDLHAYEVAVGFDDGVVGGGVSPGIEDVEAVFGGCGEELQLGPFTAALAVFDFDFYSGRLILGFHLGNKKRGLERPRPFL